MDFSTSLCVNSSRGTTAWYKEDIRRRATIPAAAVAAADEPEPDFFDAAILEMKGATFIKGTAFTHAELTNIASSAFDHFPNRFIDGSLATTVTERHNCRTASELAKWC